MDVLDYTQKRGNAARTAVMGNGQVYGGLNIPGMGQSLPSARSNAWPIPGMPEHLVRFSVVAESP